MGESGTGNGPTAPAAGSGGRAWLALGAVGLLALGCSGGTAPPDFALGGAAPRATVAPTAAPQVAPAPPKRTWTRLSEDGVHDPTNPALQRLQQPATALAELPPAVEGNQVDWVAALREGYIAPRTNIFPETKIQVLDLDVLMKETAGMAMVRFPHRPHTEWLDCANCHDKIFIPKTGANQFGMLDVLQGRYCGQCHGAVAFPLTQCHRCHSVLRTDVPASKGTQP